MTLRDHITRHPHGLIARAYRFAETAHAGQKRKNGDPYFTHVRATGETLLQWKLDESTIAAGLLHDVVEDTSVTADALAEHFGEEIAFLVEGVTKLSHIKYRGEELRTQAENLRKLIFAISQDLRVVFVKLADRLHNMRTLDALPPQKQKRIALETAEIYAPLAHRLGIQHVAGELQDLAFPYLHAQEYRWLREHVREAYEERLHYLERVEPLLKNMLRRAHINPLAIDFRAKRYWSLYQKMKLYEMDLSRVHDVVALRVIVRDVADCYAALGIVHQEWPPFPGRIKDYIAMPKPNGYRSLHTTVIGPDGKTLEIQIRTEDMHRENEYGIAAHWAYKEHRHTPSSARRLARETEWIQQLQQWQSKHATDPEKSLDAMKIDFFRDRIFVITPQGTVLDLPAGSTPVDFAYTIHSEVGDGCTGAKVNDQFVPLDYVLRSGDLVEIIVQKKKKPSKDWLAFVKTSIAKARIRAAFREKDRAFVGGPTKTEFRIVVHDRVGLIKDIANVIARAHINILGMQTNSVPGSKFPIDRVECAVTDKEKVERLLLKLKKIKEIKEISYKII